MYSLSLSISVYVYIHIHTLRAAVSKTDCFQLYTLGAAVSKTNMKIFIFSFVSLAAQMFFNSELVRGLGLRVCNLAVLQQACVCI